MGEDFSVDAEAVLGVSVDLRAQSTALDASGGALPEVDGGLMTPVIENAVGALLSNAGLLSAALIQAADAVESSALAYHASDERRREDLARLMLPGAGDAEITDAVERVGRADEIELARLMMPGDTEAAEQAVLDSPSAWEEAQERSRERSADLRDLLVPPALPKDGG
jgi:hypothetical protein